jgi:hypothetical protein
VPSELAGSAHLYGCELALVEDPLHAAFPLVTVLGFNGDITSIAGLNVKRPAELGLSALWGRNW